MQKIINFDDVTEDNIKEHNSNWPQIPDNLYRILVVRGSGFGEKNSVLNLISKQVDINKMYVCPRDTDEAKY